MFDLRWLGAGSRIIGPERVQEAYVDVFSHFLIPFAAGLWVLGLAKKRPEDPARQVVWRSRLALALVFGVAGFTPDLDGFYAWVRHNPGLYWLQHRGFSHSLLGAPLHGLLAAGGVALVGRLFPKRLGWLHWRAAYIPTAVLGSMSHLVLDMLTYNGVPLWWPMDLYSVSLNLFSWLVVWMIPVSGVVIVLFLVKRMSPRRVAQVTAVLVVLMLLYGGLRWEERPGLMPGEQAFPRSSFQEWIVLTPDPEGEGWFLQIYRGGQPHGPQWHNETHIEPGSEEAVARALDTNAYRGLVMNTPGPIVVETQPAQDGWNVTFAAVVARMDAVNDPRWTPTHPKLSEWGLLVMLVDEAGHEVVRYGW